MKNRFLSLIFQHLNLLGSIIFTTIIFNGLKSGGRDHKLFAFCKYLHQPEHSLFRYQLAIPSYKVIYAK